MKVVINDCYGGFGLSKAATYRYAALRGVTLYEREDRGFTYYYTNHSMSKESYWSPDFDIDRADRDLVQVVEELGSKAASGACAQIKIVEIPDDVEWEIEEYDGLEWIAEKHRIWR